MIPTPDDLKTLKETHGNVWIVDLDDENTVVFRKPTKAEYDRCIGTSAEDKRQAPQAMAQFVRDLVVFPAPPEFAALVREAPGISARISSEAFKVCALEVPAHAKKY